VPVPPRHDAEWSPPLSCHRAHDHLSSGPSPPATRTVASTADPRTMAREARTAGQTAGATPVRAVGPTWCRPRGVAGLRPCPACPPHLIVRLPLARASPPPLSRYREGWPYRFTAHSLFSPPLTPTSFGHGRPGPPQRELLDGTDVSSAFHPRVARPWTPSRSLLRGARFPRSRRATSVDVPHGRRRWSSLAAHSPGCSSTMSDRLLPSAIPRKRSRIQSPADGGEGFTMGRSSCGGPGSSSPRREFRGWEEQARRRVESSCLPTRKTVSPRARPDISTA
jgi:hypothetical protein